MATPGRELKLEAGTKLFQEGEASADLYIVQQGIVKVYKMVDGKQLPLGLVRQGQFVGELSFFDGKPRSATAEAATFVKLLQITKEDLESVLATLPGWMMTLIKSISSRVREADDLVKRNKIIDGDLEEEFKRITKS